MIKTLTHKTIYYNSRTSEIIYCLFGKIQTLKCADNEELSTNKEWKCSSRDWQKFEELLGKISGVSEKPRLIKRKCVK